MLGNEPVKRRNGRLVGQSDRKGPPARSVGGLSLRSGLGSHGSGGQQIASRVNLGEGVERAVVRGQIQAQAADQIGPAQVADIGRGSRRTIARAAHVVGTGGDGGGFGLGHLYLRVGPIPTMWISYPVTCYRSTTVRRLIAASPPETPPAARGAGSAPMRPCTGCPSLCCRARQPDGQTVWPARTLACSS